MYVRERAQRTRLHGHQKPPSLYTLTGGRRIKAHVASTASVELFGVILPRAAAAPVAMMYATHRISRKCSPDASAALCFTRLGHMHLTYVKRASYVTCCGAVNPRPPRGRSAAPDSWRAPRGPPHAAPTPSGPRERRACVPWQRLNNGRSSARAAAATHWLRIRPTPSGQQPAPLPTPTRPNLYAGCGGRITSEQRFSAVHSLDPPAKHSTQLNGNSVSGGESASGARLRQGWARSMPLLASIQRVGTTDKTP